MSERIERLVTLGRVRRRNRIAQSRPGSPEPERKRRVSRSVYVLTSVEHSVYGAQPGSVAGVYRSLSRAFEAARSLRKSPCVAISDGTGWIIRDLAVDVQLDRYRVEKVMVQ